MDMKKWIQKAASLATALTLAALPLAQPFCASAAYSYTSVEGTSCSFTKYLIVNAGDSVPNATFSFTIAPGEARSADTSDNSVMQVIPGPTGQATVNAQTVTTPYIGDVAFNSSDATSSAPASGAIDILRTASDRGNGLTAATGVEFNASAGEKFASHAVTVNFTGVRFNEPGIYRYIITETANAAHETAGIMHDNDTDRVLDVYVTDGGQGALVVSGYVLHLNDADVVINNTMGSADVATAAAALSDKTDGFTNEYKSKDLAFKLEVTGNQASRDKWFEVTAKVEDLNDNDVFAVSLGDDSDPNTTDGDADAVSGTTSSTREANQGKTNPTSLTGAQLKAGVKFYLQHGQSIAIRGLSPNARYTVTEDPEDYRGTASAVSGYEKATSGVIGTVAGSDKAVKTSYLNTRDGIIPTGVATAPIIAAFAVMAACAAGIAIVAWSRKAGKTA